MLDPDTNALLLLYDDAQAIYSKTRRAVSFASLGIQARGRTTILKLNYRNTWEVLAVAKAFAGELFEGSDSDEDAPAVVSPESVGRHGPVPTLTRLDSRRAEAGHIAKQIHASVACGIAADQIAVLWRHRSDAQLIADALSASKIAFRWAVDGATKDALFEGGPSVKLVSMHSSKGLEFEHVYIPGIDRLSADAVQERAEARLLYVAMTRSMRHLSMTASGTGGLTTRVSQALLHAAA